MSSLIKPANRLINLIFVSLISGATHAKSEPENLLVNLTATQTGFLGSNIKEQPVTKNLDQKNQLLEEVGIKFNEGFKLSDLAQMWGNQTLLEAELLELIELTAIGLESKPDQAIANLTATSMGDSVFSDQDYPNIIKKLASAAGVMSELEIKKSQIDWDNQSALVEFEFNGKLFRITPVVNGHQLDMQALSATASLFENSTDEDLTSVVYMRQGYAYWLYINEDHFELLEGRLEAVDLLETTFIIDYSVERIE